MIIFTNSFSTNHTIYKFKGNLEAYWNVPFFQSFEPKLGSEYASLCLCDTMSVPLILVNCSFNTKSSIYKFESNLECMLKNPLFFKILHQNLNLNIRDKSRSWEWACRYVRQVEYAGEGGDLHRSQKKPYLILHFGSHLEVHQLMFKALTCGQGIGYLAKPNIVRG